MSNTVLIMGESGTGKSTSIRTLDPKETFLISVLNKPLPFRGWRKKYKKADGSEGNMITCDVSRQVNAALIKINDTRKDIKTVIIDDFQYLMSNEFMRRALEAGWGKFTEIQKDAWGIIITAMDCRSDLNIFVLSHSEVGPNGKTKMKTIGKVLDDKIVVEGMFTLVLSSVILDDKYCFQTRSDPQIMAKTPMGMFEDKYIDNDLQMVNSVMNEYFNEELQEDVNQ